MRGRRAEEAAREALVAAGFTVIESNFRVRGAEIDVVARDDGGVVFAEVRARAPGPVEPSATIDRAKFHALLRGARAWIARHEHGAGDWRFVVVSVSFDEQGRPVGTEIIEDPFTHLPEFHQW